MLTLLRLKPFGDCGDWEMECEKVLLVLHYEEAAHRFKFFRRGSWPARDELLASVCQGLGLAPGTSLRFFDEDDDQVLLNSCVPSGTELTVVAGAGADAGAPFHASPMAPVGVDGGANRSSADRGHIG